MNIKINYIFIFGNINGYYDDKLNLKKINKKKLLDLISKNKINFLDGKFLIIQILNKNELKIYTDYFRRYEVYYYKKMKF